MMAFTNNIQLVLFFTQGMSLRAWAGAGMLEREVALYRALRPHLGGITFVTYGNAQDNQYQKQLPGIGVVCNQWRLPLRWYVHLLHRLYPALWRGAVVFKSNQVQGADVALWAARRCGRPFIARCGYLHSDFMERQHGPDSPQAAQARTLERQLFTQADRIIVTTAAMQQAIAQNYQVSADRITIIPNYVQTDLFRPVPQEIPLPKRICFIGRLHAQKNPFALLEAIEGLDVELVMVGEGALRAELEAMATAKSLPVRFLGNLPHPQLSEILNSATLFILPSHYEGHPKALLEAMACGRPVIGADVPGIRDLLRHRETGYLCGTSPAEIRAAIVELLGDPELQAHMGRNARDFVVEHFALERIVEMERALLAEVTTLTLTLSPREREQDPVSPRPLGGGTLPPPRPLGEGGRGVRVYLRRSYPVRKIMKRTLLKALDKLPTSRLEAIIQRLVIWRAMSLPPAEALRFLFRLDAGFYALQGAQAVRYGGGTHPKHRHMRYHDFFVARVRPGEKVLDIGCGIGAVAYDVAEKARATVIGIDLSRTNIAQARRLYAHPRVHYCVGDALQAVPGGTFDVVILSNVLEHLPGRPDFLRRVQAVAKPARFLIRVPLFERDWRVPLKRELGVEWRLDDTHETEYTLESFAEEAEAAGLRITHQEVHWGEVWAELSKK
jgi:glycosyltransferase involved in cell wall biosynthesis/2-polyprenyl-3-methyl-5-hydroxy-6-metoxy-1,4-benzoquinol methylase